MALVEVGDRISLNNRKPFYVVTQISQRGTIIFSPIRNRRKRFLLVPRPKGWLLYIYQREGKKLINRAPRVKFFPKKGSPFLTGIHELDIKILGNLDDQYLCDALQVNQYAQSLSFNETLWRDRIEPILLPQKNLYLTWRDFYIRTRNSFAVQMQKFVNKLEKEGSVSARIDDSGPDMSKFQHALEADFRSKTSTTCTFLICIKISYSQNDEYVHEIQQGLVTYFFDTGRVTGFLNIEEYIPEIYTYDQYKVMAEGIIMSLFEKRIVYL